MDVEKLRKIKETEDRAREILEGYRRKAETAVSEAREEADRLVATEEARAREKSESEAEAMISLAGTEALELRQEYMFDVHYLENMVARKRSRAVGFLLEKLLEG